MGKKRKFTDDDNEFDLSRKAKEVKNDNEKRLIIVLENAQLETVKVIKSSIILLFNIVIIVTLLYSGGESF